MLLTDRIHECCTNMYNVNVNRSKIAEKDTTVRTNNSFFIALDKFVKCVESIAIANEYQYHFDESLITNIKECITYIDNTFDKKNAMRVESFRTRVSSIDNSLSQDWMHYCNIMNQKMIEKLAILKVISKNQFEINSLKNCIDNFKNWPLDINMKNAYDKSNSRANELINDMHFDDEIERFLMKVSNREATLLDLNDSILKWIKEENLEKSIALNIKI